MKANKILLPMLLSLFCLSVAGQSRALVVGGKAGLRNSPNGKINFTVAKNTQLKILKKKYKKGWRYVAVKKKEGWIETSKIKILIDDLPKRTIWLFIGRSAKMNGFNVAYYLNTAQLVRNGNTVNFWTKMVPSNNSAYLNTLMARSPKRKPVNFNYNADQWEGNCSTKKIRVVKSLLYWKNGQVDTAKTAKSKTDVSGHTAAKSILNEACKIGKKL